MPQRITLINHLSHQELQQHYRQSKNVVESRQYHVIWLLAQGKKTEEVQQITGYSRTWIYKLVQRYNQFGFEGLQDRRKNNRGSEPLIDDVVQAHLWQVLQENAPEGGRWNGRQVADWLTQVTGKKISRQREWEILGQMTFRLRVPRPCHTDSDLIEQEKCQKKLLSK